MKILAIDAGTKYTGYALFEDKTLKDYGLFKGGHFPIEERIKRIRENVKGYIARTNPDIVVIEFPAFYASNKGYCAMMRSDTLQLARLCGNIEAVCPEAIMVTYNKWGGNLGKKRMCEKVKELYNIDAKYNSIQNNFVDAIMLGRWYLEKVLNLF